MLWPVMVCDCARFYLLRRLCLWLCWCVVSCSILQLFFGGSMTKASHILLVLRAGRVSLRYALNLDCHTYGSYGSPACIGLPPGRPLLTRTSTRSTINPACKQAWHRSSACVGAALMHECSQGSRIACLPGERAVFTTDLSIGLRMCILFCVWNGCAGRAHQCK